MQTLNGFVTGRLKDIGCTKKQLEEILHISNRTLNSKLNNPSQMDIETAMKISDFIGVGISEFCEVAYGK